MRRASLAALFAVLALAAPAQAADVSVHFDAAELTAGQNVDEFYLTNPGFIFGQGVENPQGGEFPTYSSCSTRIEPRGNAPSAPNVARLACGGTPEFPDPPVLFGKFTTATRTRVAMRVGDAGTGGHQMRLSIYDGQGRLLNRSPTTAIAANGTTLQTAAGQPEVTYWVLEEMGNSSSPGIWVDDVVVDTPVVAGQPQFGLVRTAGKGTLVVRQGLNATTDITLYRTNSSTGNVGFAITGLPPGVDAALEPSPNGRSFTVTAAIQAEPTGPTDPVIVITGTPQDSNTGTVTQRVSIPIRITRAITLSPAETPGGVALPTCGPIRVAYSVASDVGPASFSMAPLPPGVVPTIDGVDIGSAPGVSGSGVVSLDFKVPQQVNADVNAVLTLTGKEEFDPVVFGSRRYLHTAPLGLRGLRDLFDLNPTFGQTPRELKPGTTVRVRSADACGGPDVRLRFGNDRALAPIGSVEGDQMTAEVPRLATPGDVQLVRVDAAGAVGPIRTNGPRMEIDNYRNTVGFDFSNFKPDFTLDQMVTAFGRHQVYFTPNICGTFTFGLINCRVGTPIPDPWALIVLNIAEATMGGSSGGVCFGYSTVSQQIRRGERSLAGLGAPGATNGFSLGEGPNNGPPGGINEALNAAQLTQLSEPYLEFYARNAVGNTFVQTPSRLRRVIEDHLRGGEHPKLSVRNGGTFDGLHVVVAYDVYTDPANPGNYYIDVLDSNDPFLDDPSMPLPDDRRTLSETRADGADHETLHNNSRIHVRNDGSWSMPSTNGYGGRSIDNIIVSPSGMPPNQPKLISAGGALKNGLTILFGWTASSIANARVAGANAAQAGRDEETPPADVTQIRSGDRFLYKEDGEINDDPATALRATPWSPAVQATPGDTGEATEGFILAAGPGAEYTVEAKGERTAPQSRTIMGDNVIANITTQAKEGVVDKFSVVPRNDEVGYDPGSSSAPLNVQMMVRAGDGSTRTIEADLTTTGTDTVSFDSSESEIVIDHKGPPTVVDLTLSATGRSTLPRAATAKVRLGRNAKTTLKPASWKKLGKGKLRVRSKGRSRRVKLRRKVGNGAKVTSLRIAGKKPRIARAAVRVPASVTRGTATLNFILRRGRRVIATRAIGAGGAGTRTLTWALPAKARRGDRVVAAATTLIARGSTFNSATSQRQARVR